MAKKRSKRNSDNNFQSLSDVELGSFTKGLVRDFDENFDPESSWPYARNASNNSKEGDLGVIGNEPSNYLCSSAPYTIIGRIHIINQYWVIFSTDNVNSEIGLYDEGQCNYRTIVNDQCLNFSKLNLITGVAKENFDCKWAIYFADGRNVDRFINIGDMSLWPTVPYIGNNYYQDNTLWPGVQWVQDCTEVNSCNICTDTNVLNCDRIRINSLVKTPCITLTQGSSGGNIPNGSYIAFVAYSLDGERYGDYFSPSNVQYIFTHENIGGSLQVQIDNLETSSFNEFELVISSTVNEATVARRIGIYATAPSVTVSLDTIDQSLITIPIESLTLRTPLYDTSDSVFETSNYLLKVGPRTTFDFNYQPLANQIQANWVIAQYPANYYKDQGYVTGYMRDEVYSFWIRWIYSTGERSKSYHIPGRPENPGETDFTGASIYTDPNERVFEAKNTATGVGIPLGSQFEVEDGGIAIARGSMGYWESTEKYPDRNPEVWNSTFDSNFSGTYDTDYDLCNKPIRHHKMPEDIFSNNVSYTRATATGNELAKYINILGVQFNNIKPPVYKDENGVVKVISGIVGYEILRGSRQGNKSVIAKGIINNMRRYTTASEDAGLYPNYPYNPVTNIYGDYLDPTLSKTPVNPNGSNWTKVTESDIKKNYFTFHSPDTSFYRPFLSAKELRLYTELGSDNNVLGQFEEVPGHPKQKLLTDLSLITSLIVGIGEASQAIKGKQGILIESPKVLNVGLTGNPFSLVSNTSAGTIAASNTTINTTDSIAEAVGADTIANASGVNEGFNLLYNGWGIGLGLFGGIGRGRNTTFEQSSFNESPTPLRVLGGIMTFVNLVNTATNNTLDLVTSMVKWRQYALRYISHGVLHRDNIGNVQEFSNKRARLLDAGYINNQFNIFNNNRVNNLYRSATVALLTDRNILNPARQDNSITSVGTNTGAISWATPGDPNKPFKEFTTTASCYYAGLKLRNRNQYGQLDSIEQIPVPCRQIVNNNLPIPNTAVTIVNGNTLFNTIYSSDVLFGGDIYIGRYTEKNTFFYFYDWLYGEPDGTIFDYTQKFLGLYPRYWANFEDYDIEGFFGSVMANILSPNQWNTPANNNNLDGFQEYSLSSAFGAGGENSGFTDVLQGIFSQISFGRKNAYMYLFQSAVRDFYVESEYNIAQRDWGEVDEQKHYEILSNLRELFFTNIIKSGNYFKLNPSLSISRLFFNVISWGNMQDRSYNPTVAELCFRYLPNRVIYSLPNTLESNKDYWRVFLPNNYKDFRSQVTAIRPIGKNGAIIFFRNDSPVQIQGTETLESEIGTKITVGTGALFSQSTQSIVNTDDSFEYGSCQDKFSIINTPSGIYWISQSQGKIFTIGDGLDEISGQGMRWWFSKFLPFRLLVDFPEFEVIDNPVVGIGCQSIYDNDFLVAYFCKKDYELRKDLPENTTVTYVSGIDFLVNNLLKVKLGDPNYFNDVSWTISFDPKNKMWISFHDWHPTLSISSNNNFITIQDNSMWRHNDTTSSFCNYYGQDYPFQLEYVVDSGQTVNTLRSIEYILESYVYDIDGIDRFQLLDYNFDELTVYNSEQVSGKLNLIVAPKDNPFVRLNYPQINFDSIDIIYEKVEQKFRINQFWDITADRGEYNVNVQRPIWLTEWDGYTRELNPANLNYAKSVFERKKFRHYYSNVLFTKRVSGNKKMLMKLANNKNLLSPR